MRLCAGVKDLILQHSCRTNQENETKEEALLLFMYQENIPIEVANTHRREQE